MQKYLYQTADSLYQTADRSLSIRQRMRETLYQQRMQKSLYQTADAESLYQTADAEDTLSDSGCLIECLLHPLSDRKTSASAV